MLARTNDEIGASLAMILWHKKIEKKEIEEKIMAEAEFNQRAQKSKKGMPKYQYANRVSIKSNLNFICLFLQKLLYSF